MSIGLGCMRLSTDAARDPDRGRAVIAAAVAAGVDLLDTSDAYALDAAELGHNERLIAAALAEPPARPRVEVVTKGGLTRPGGAWVANGRARHLASAARASRDRLGVAAIDLYLLHAVDPNTPLATSVRALARLRADGVVRRIGLSNIGVLQLEAAQAIAPIDAVEIELSPWNLDALRGGLVAACDARGIRVLAHRPLGGPAGVRRAAADPVLAELAARIGATPAELILAWLRTLSPQVIPLPGASRVATAISAARAAALALDDDARAALAARFLGLGNPRERAPHRGSHRGSKKAGSPVPAAITAAVGNATTPASPPSRSAGTPDVSGSSGNTTEETPSPSTNRELRDGDGVSFVSFRIAGAVNETKETPSPSRLSVDETTETPSPAPGVVVILGIQGSGKSTLAASYAARGYLRLNRDELGGTLVALARRLDRELASGIRHVVIDNTYPTRASRALVVDVARRHGLAVHCVVMATSIEDAQSNAVSRILARHGRLLMPGGIGAPNELARAGEIDPRVQFRFRREYEEPRADEGFATIEHVPFVRAVATGGAPALIIELDDVVWRARPRTPDAIELRDGAGELLQAWSRTHVLAGTTWQPGLARVDALAARLAELVGLPLHVMHSAHAAGPPVCWCRKPLPGLAFALAQARGLDLGRSLHLGRGPADRGFALRAGMRYVDVTAGWPWPQQR